MSEIRSSRLGIDQFGLDAFPEGGFDGAARNQIDSRAKQLFQALGGRDKPESDAGFHFNQNIDITLSRDGCATSIGAEECEAPEREFRLKFVL